MDTEGSAVHWPHCTAVICSTLTTLYCSNLQNTNHTVLSAVHWLHCTALQWSVVHWPHWPIYFLMRRMNWTAFIWIKNFPEKLDFKASSTYIYLLYIFSVLKFDFIPSFYMYLMGSINLLYTLTQSSSVNLSLLIQQILLSLIC